MTRFHDFIHLVTLRLPGTRLTLGTPRAGWQQCLAATKLFIRRIGVFVFLVSHWLRLCEACRAHHGLWQHRQRGWPAELQGGTNRHGVSVGSPNLGPHAKDRNVTPTLPPHGASACRSHLSWNAPRQTGFPHRCPSIQRGRRVLTGLLWTPAVLRFTCRPRAPPPALSSVQRLSWRQWWPSSWPGGRGSVAVGWRVVSRRAEAFFCHADRPIPRAHMRLSRATHQLEVVLLHVGPDLGGGARPQLLGNGVDVRPVPARGAVCVSTQRCLPCVCTRRQAQQAPVPQGWRRGSQLTGSEGVPEPSG